MKYLIIILLSVLSFSVSAQWNISGQKTRFAVGLGIPYKDAAGTFNTQDSAQIFIGWDSGLYYRYKAVHKVLNVGDTSGMLSPYLRINVAAATYTPLITSISTGYGLSGGGDFSTNRTHIVDSATLANYFIRRKDSSIAGGYYPFSTNPKSYLVAADIAGKLNISDTASMLSTYLRSNVAATTYLTKANNLSDLASAATSRTNLGGTTIGQNVFTLANPSAITFPRYNADNTVSALDAATFRTAIGAGTESALTFTSGLTRATNTVTNDLSTGIAASNQNAYGSTLSGGSLTLNSTSNATKGFIYFGAAHTTAYDGVNGRFGVGNGAPSYTFDVTGNSRFNGHIGVGASSITQPNIAAYIAETFTDVGIRQIGSEIDLTSVYTSSSSNESHGLVINAYEDPSGFSLSSNTALIGIFSTARLIGTGTLSGVQGGFFRAENSSTGTITNAIGGKFGNPTNTGGGTITGAAGIMVQNQTAGGTNNVNLALGVLNIVPTGTWSIYNASTYDNYFAGNIQVADKDFILGTATGTKFGTATTQKLSFYNSTPIVKPSGNLVIALSNLGLVASGTVNASTDFTGTLQAGQEPAHTGDATNPAGSLALTIANSAITQAKTANYSAYTLWANNTNASAAPADATFKDIAEQTYAGTIAWDGTPPSSTTTHTYSWTQIGSMVILRINLKYASPGITNTQVTMTIPADCPTPFAPTGFGSNSDFGYVCYGKIATATNVQTTAANVCGLGLNASGVWTITALSASISAKVARVTVIYGTH